VELAEVELLAQQERVQAVYQIQAAAEVELVLTLSQVAQAAPVLSLSDIQTYTQI